jgi:hypothetical protein
LISVIKSIPYCVLSDKQKKKRHRRKLVPLYWVFQNRLTKLSRK